MQNHDKIAAVELSTPVLFQFGVVFEVGRNVNGEWDLSAVTGRARELLAELETLPGFLQSNSACTMTYLRDESTAMQCNKCGRWAVDWRSDSLKLAIIGGQQYSDGFYCLTCRAPASEKTDH